MRQYLYKVGEMDEEFSDSKEESGNNNHGNRGSIVSLDRMSGRSREPSLRNRPSLIQVMSLDGSQMSDDIYDYYEFEERRRSMVRQSGSSRFGSNNENSMDIEDNSRGAPRRSSNNRGPNHDCKCDGNCLEYHCSCYSEPNEMCLLGSCCLNCIRMKNEHMLGLTKTGCNCKQAKCAKSQCKCFQSGSPCDPLLCKCDGCGNPKPSKQVEKKGVQKGKVAKNSGVSCSCKKSHCLKKYCICFSSGKECGAGCVCEECHNQYEEDEDKEEKDQERQRYGRVQEEVEEDIDQYFQEKDYEDQEMPASMEFEHPDLKFSYQH